MRPFSPGSQAMSPMWLYCSRWATSGGIGLLLRAEARHLACGGATEHAPAERAVDERGELDHVVNSRTPGTEPLRDDCSPSLRQQVVGLTSERRCRGMGAAVDDARVGPEPGLGTQAQIEVLPVEEDRGIERAEPRKRFGLSNETGGRGPAHSPRA